MTGWLAVLSCLLLQTPPNRLGPVPKPQGKTASPQELHELSQRFRRMALDFVPSPLYQKDHGWGNTTWTKERFSFLKKDPDKLVQKNHGTWRKVKVTADDLPQTLVLQITRYQQPTPKLISFDMFVSFDTRMQVIQQNWRKGVKLLDGEIRARMKVKVMLSCVIHLETRPTKYLLPSIVFRLKVKHAEVDYENLVTEHFFGLGGDGAKIVGELLIDIMREVKPSLKQKLLEKLERSLVKALDNKEVKVNVGKLFDKKK